MTQTKKQHIHIWIDFVSKLQICLSDQVVMCICQISARSSGAIHKIDADLWMVDQQSNQFATCVARTSNNAGCFFSFC